MPKGYVPKGKKDRRGQSELKTLETTIHLHKYLKGRTFKKRAPFAVKVVRAAAKRFMRTADNRLDTKLNKAIWSQGIKGCPHRLRIRLERKRNEEEDASESLYTVCTFVRVPRGAFKGLQTRRISASDE
eukprot:Hpha_TRINITY_DN14488_c0_g3::TRINITY_DN14488_c0_g3_i1::g.157701::m.157701/K02910/RP-L31e, RPL31; large subunit ribosomal protein L31e